VQWRLPALAAALWAIIFAVIGTVVGLLIHGLVGALLGAIFGLLATAVVGFLPSIRDAALRRQRELHELEGQVETAQAAWDAVPLEYSVAWLTCAVADSWTW
jgi:hypothetical protein